MGISMPSATGPGLGSRRSDQSTREASRRDPRRSCEWVAAGKPRAPLRTVCDLRELDVRGLFRHLAAPVPERAPLDPRQRQLYALQRPRQPLHPHPPGHWVRDGLELVIELTHDPEIVSE